MSDLRVETVTLPQLGGSPFFGFAVRAHAELLESGFADPCAPLLYHSTRAVVATVQDEPIGVIAYNHAPHDRSLNVALGFVLADYRRRRVYRGLWEEVVKEARRLDCGRIYGVVSSKNSGMLRVAAALGRRVESVNVVYEV